MPFLGIDPEETKEVILLSDKNVILPKKAKDLRKLVADYHKDYDRSLLKLRGEPTVFKIGVLYYRRRQRVLYDLRGSEQIHEWVRWGVRGWKNLTNSKGVKIESKTEVNEEGGAKEVELSPESMEELGNLFLLEGLHFEVIRLNTPTEEEIKKSEPPPDAGSSDGTAESVPTRS